MAGSALACALAHSSYRIAVIESQASPCFNAEDFYDARVVALNAASQQFLQQIGVWDDIATQRISPYTHMQVWDAEGTAQVTFDCADTQQSALGHIVENNLIVAALQNRLRQCSQIDWLCPESVTELHDSNIIHSGNSACELLLHSGRTIRARLVVAADGALSTVRRLSGIKTLEWDYGHTALIATVKNEKPHQRTARQRFTAGGPLAFLPLLDRHGDEHWSSIVWSTSAEKAQALLAMTEVDFATALDNAFEHRLGAVTAVRSRFAFPLRQRHAQLYHRGRVVLIGDAAHTIHPLAGQGVNLGFMDVQTLAEELLAAQLRKLSPAHASVLQRYQRRRRGANLAMTATMELFKRLFERDELPLRWLRNTGMRGIESLPWLKRQIMRKAMGI